MCVCNRRKRTTERPFLTDLGTEEGLRLLYGEILVKQAEFNFCLGSSSVPQSER